VSRPDVDAVHHMGENHGFDLEVGGPPGASVCVYAINVGPGSNSLIACRAAPP